MTQTGCDFECPGVVFVAHGGVLDLVVEELVGSTDVLGQPVILSNDMLGKQVVVVSERQDTLVSHWNKTNQTFPIRG